MRSAGRRRRTILGVIAVVAVAAGCAAPEGTGPNPAAGVASVAASRSMTIYRSTGCSCCHLWAQIARDGGWNVAAADVTDMATFMADHGIPAEAASCHVTLVDGYAVVGHVPLAAIERLLADRPDIDGIALPGMPAGSPGMSGSATAPFEVIAFSEGTVSPFGSY
jgi:hypothetical protein